MVQAAFELVSPPTSSYVQRHWRLILLTLSAAAIASGWLLHGTSPLTVLRSSRLCYALGCIAPRRLLFRGSLISLPGRAEPALLRGFNIVLKHGEAGLDHVTRQDRLLFKLLPHTSLVRLVVNHWADDVTAPGADCYDDAAEDFLRPECLALLEEAVSWVTEAGAFAVITARSALAAGDAGANASVFENITLRMHWVRMWGAVARRFASTDNIAGYEVMSELFLPVCTMLSACLRAETYSLRDHERALQCSVLTWLTPTIGDERAAHLRAVRGRPRRAA